jgi:hypothetical protein
MPILVLLAVLAALIYGAVRSFDALSQHFGMQVAVAAAVVAALLLAAAVAWWWRRWREVAPNIHEGDWTHQLVGEWGVIRLAAEKRLCEIQVDGVKGAYIFADLQRAEAQQASGGWRLAIEVKDAARPQWLVPMSGARQARQWKRIFDLAIRQKL